MGRGALLRENSRGASGRCEVVEEKEKHEVGAMGEFRPLWGMIQVGWRDATVTPRAAHRFIRDERLKVYATRSGYQFDFLPHSESSYHTNRESQA